MVRTPSLLAETLQFSENNHILMLNSAADPVVQVAIQQLTTGSLLLAEDSIASIKTPDNPSTIQQIAFHDYLLHHEPATSDIAIMNLLYQPGNSWVYYGLRVASYALRTGGRLYVTGAKDRGILSVAKRMQESFGNVETLKISKGQRVLCSSKTAMPFPETSLPEDATLHVFADSKLDEGTRLLLETLEVRPTDEALDIGCGAGFLGLHIARLASNGHVTMVDASRAAVAAAQQATDQSGLTNVRALPSDGVQAVLSERFDLIVTNPPFHQGGIQTTAIAERFIREAAQVLKPRGRFYLVANRFLKYEPIMQACFKQVEEVGGNTRYKVLKAT